MILSRVLKMAADDSRYLSFLNVVFDVQVVVALTTRIVLWPLDFAVAWGLSVIVLCSIASVLAVVMATIKSRSIGWFMKQPLWAKVIVIINLYLTTRIILDPSYFIEPYILK